MSRTNPITARAERLLAESARWMTGIELAAALSVQHKSLRAALRPLVDAGRLLRSIADQRACYCTASVEPPPLEIEVVGAKRRGPPPRVWTLDYVRARCDEVGECWLWKQGTQGQGYPQASINGKQGVSVRTFVYVELMGKRAPTSRRSVITSRCGNQLCVSPACLTLRSHSTIIREQWRDGQRSRASLHGIVKRKLTPEQVDEIRALPQGFNQCEVARRMGVHAKTVHKAATGKTFRARPASSVFEWRGAA